MRLLPRVRRVGILPKVSEDGRGIERHYSGRELAALLAVNPETIRREAVRGKLRSVRVGVERRYPESAIREYLGEEGGRAA